MKRFIENVLSILSRVLNKHEVSYDVTWKDQESIFDFIKRHIDNQYDCLQDSDIKLPDETKLFTDDDLHWVSGGLDGAYIHNFGVKSERKIVNKISKLLLSIAKNGSEKSKSELYKILEKDSVIDFIDPALEKTTSRGISAEPYLYDFAKSLAFHSPDRGPVKFAIALLGLIRNPDDLELIRTLGKHEEFTLYSAVAITNMLESPDLELYHLAQAVDGWGKIHLVERLSHTKNEEIQNWLLRKGYQNRIMYEYLAYICAVTGNLHKALDAEFIDKELFDGAGEIIESLINGGPAESIDDYEYSSEAIKGYLRHFSTFPFELKHFIVLHSIKVYLTDLEFSDDSSEDGWDSDSQSQALMVIEKLLDNVQWRSLAEKGLSNDDDSVFYGANRAAKLLNMDTWDIHWKRLSEKPTDSGRWYAVMSQVNSERIDVVLGFASRELPLEDIATGAGNEMGLGPNFESHSCLDYILQELYAYPGKGKDLILTGLKSPVVRNRNMALNALEAWDKSLLDEEIIKSLGSALSVEPNEDIKKRIDKLL